MAPLLLLLLLLHLTTATAPLPTQCLDYRVLDSPHRSVNTPHGVKLCHTDDFYPYFCCDWCANPCTDDFTAPDWFGETWYRLMSGDSDGQLPTQSPGEDFHCGTLSPGWMEGTHPAVEEGQVARTVYFQGGNDPYYLQVEIVVTNCSDYYVYLLPNTPYCSFGYCVE